MNAPPDHRALSELLPSAALEILEAGELQHVLAHARGCTECDSRLGEYRELLSLLALQLPRRPMDPRSSADLRARLLARARSESRSPRVSFTGRWSGWLVAAALSGVLLMHHGVHRPLAYGWIVAGALAIALVALGLYARSQHTRGRELAERLARSEHQQKPR